MEVEKLFLKEPQLKSRKFKYNEEENSVENIATNKGNNAKLIRKEQEHHNSAIIETY